MEDDSFKYLGHENPAQLLAELRNKMGFVTSLSDVLKLEKTANNKEVKDFVKKMKPKAQENFLKGIPLILRYLDEFEQYDLNNIRKSII